MALSKRERYIAIGAGAVLGLLALDQVVLTPMFSALASVTDQVNEAKLKQSEAEKLFAKRRIADRRWAQMTNGSLLRSGSESENQVLSRVREWAQASGMTLASLKPERNEKEKDFQRIVIRATGTGSMSQVTEFLNRIQTSQLPIRVADMQIASRKEGSDDLAVQLGVATIYQPADKTNDKAAEVTR